MKKIIILLMLAMMSACATQKYAGGPCQPNKHMVGYGH